MKQINMIKTGAALLGLLMSGTLGFASQETVVVAVQGLSTDNGEQVQGVWRNTTGGSLMISEADIIVATEGYFGVVAAGASTNGMQFDYVECPVSKAQAGEVNAFNTTKSYRPNCIQVPAGGVVTLTVTPESSGYVITDLILYLEVPGT